MAIFGLDTTIREEIIRKEDSSIVPLMETKRLNEDFLVGLTGYSWEVTYFHRNITNYSLVTQYDPGLDISLQELTRINKTVLKVEDPLPQASENGLTGSAILDISVIPTYNDIFLTKLPDGRTGLFVVTNITRFNYNQEKIFKIDYELSQAFTDVNDVTLVKILSAVTETFTFNKDYRKDNATPLFSSTDISNRNKVIGYINKLVTFMADKFIIPTTNFYLAYIDNIDSKAYYDIHMEQFIKDTIGINNFSPMTETIDLDCTDISILDYIVKTDYLPSRIKRYVNNNSSTSYTSNPYLFSLTYNDIDFVTTVTDINDTSITSDNAIVNTIFPKISNKNYIFRDVVYDVINGVDISTVVNDLTKFEYLFLNMITGNVITDIIITEVYNEIYKLDDKEQFYFIPILNYIIRYYILTFTVKYI